MSKHKHEEIRFQLANIELVGVELALPGDFSPVEVYEYEVLAESRLNHERRMIRLRLEINIKSERVKCGSLTSLFWYSIEDFDSVIQKNKSGKSDIPEGLKATLNSISISTARGLLFSAFRGTALHNAILPIIDPKIYSTD